MRFLLLACLALLPLRLAAANSIELRYASFYGDDAVAPKVLDLMTGDQIGLVLMPPTPIPPNGLLNGEQTKEVTFATTFDENGDPKTTVTRKVGPVVQLTVKSDGKDAFKVDVTLKEIVRNGDRITLGKTGKANVMPILENIGFEAAGIACPTGRWVLYTAKDAAGSKWMALAIRINPPPAP